MAEYSELQDCKEPYKFTTLSELHHIGSPMVSVFPERWDETVILTVGDYSDVEELYQGISEQHFWYPIALRVVSSINDCIKGHCTEPLTKENRTAIVALLKNSADRRGNINVQKVCDKIIAYQIRVPFLNKALVEQDKHKPRREKVTIVYKLNNVLSQIEVPMLFDYALEKVLKDKYREYVDKKK